MDWDDARIFLAVAEARSLSGAARQLALGQATVSRRIGELEATLGVELFKRSRRGVEPTTLAREMIPAAREMDRWAAELRRVIENQGDSPTGRVRLAAPPGFAYDFLVPFCAWLRESHPRIDVEVFSGVRFLDLARGEADVAIRNRATTESGVVEVGRREFEVGAFVSVELAELLGERPAVGDVPWICWAGPNERLQPRPELEALIPGFEPAFASDDYLVQLRACEEGLGAVFLPRVTHPLLDDRGLVELELGLPPICDTIHIVCARSMRSVPRVQVLLAALLDQLDRVRPR